MPLDWHLVGLVISNVVVLAWAIRLRVLLATRRRAWEEREAEHRWALTNLNAEHQRELTMERDKRIRQLDETVRRALDEQEQPRELKEAVRRERLSLGEERMLKEPWTAEARQTLEELWRLEVDWGPREERVRHEEVDARIKREAMEAEIARARSRLEAIQHNASMAAIGGIDSGKSQVRFRAGAPRTTSPGAEVSVRFVAYTPKEERRVKALLEGIAEGAAARSEYSETSWALGTRARVKCCGDSLLVTPEFQDFIWEGRRTHLDFDIAVPQSTHPGASVRVRFDVFVDGFIVARLRIPLEIVLRKSAADDRHDVMTEAARTAFASYASSDRARVLDRVASVRTSTGLDVWMDCVNLRPNDRWQELLGPEIENRDLFFLFWSNQAAVSHWVDWEWRTALERKGINAMQLHPLENVPDTLPAELGELHSTDPLMTLRDAARHS